MAGKGKSKFTHKTAMNFTHAGQFYTGHVVYHPPTQLERIAMAQMENESETEHHHRTLKTITENLVSLELGIYDIPEDWSDKDKEDVDKLLEEKSSLQFVQSFHDIDTVMYYAFFDSFVLHFGSVFGTGILLGNGKKAK